MPAVNNFKGFWFYFFLEFLSCQYGEVKTTKESMHLFPIQFLSTLLSDSNLFRNSGFVMCAAWNQKLNNRESILFKSFLSACRLSAFECSLLTIVWHFLLNDIIIFIGFKSKVTNWLNNSTDHVRKRLQFSPTKISKLWLDIFFSFPLAQFSVWHQWFYPVYMVFFFLSQQSKDHSQEQRGW